MFSENLPGKINIFSFILHMFLGVQVETMLSITGFEGMSSLVAQATLSGDKAIFEAVTTALVTRLGSNQVRYRLLL